MVVVSLDNFEKFDVVKPLPHQEQLKKWLKLGARIAGGFPVWAAGFSSRYTDIDLYADTWDTFTRIRGDLHVSGKYLGDTRETSQYVVNQTTFQLVNPFEEHKTIYDLINNTDMSATATALCVDRDKLVVISLYPDDLKNHINRILIDHEWTGFRAEAYRQRGFTIVNKDGSPYEIKMPMPPMP